MATADTADVGKGAWTIAARARCSVTDGEFAANPELVAASCARFALSESAARAGSQVQAFSIPEEKLSSEEVLEYPDLAISDAVVTCTGDAVSLSARLTATPVISTRCTWSDGAGGAGGVVVTIGAGIAGTVITEAAGGATATGLLGSISIVGKTGAATGVCDGCILAAGKVMSGAGAGAGA